MLLEESPRKNTQCAGPHLNDQFVSRHYQHGSASIPEFNISPITYRLDRLDHLYFHAIATQEKHLMILTPQPRTNSAVDS